jgi:hypothetical protein
MPSSGMLRSVAVVRTDVSEERFASNIMVTIIGKLETTLAVTNNRSTLRRNAQYSVFLRSGYTIELKSLPVTDVGCSEPQITLQFGDAISFHGAPFCLRLQ